MTSPTLDRRQGLVGNTPMKAPCDLATTGPITLSGEQLIDGTQTATSRVLVKDQADQTTNGIYTTSSAAWTRSADADGTYDLAQGTMVYVNGGAANANSLFNLTTPSPVVGTTSLVWRVLNSIINLASSIGASLIGWIQTGVGAVLRTIQDRLRDRVSALDFTPTAMRAAILAYTSTDDHTAYIQAALNTGKRVLLPAGLWNVTPATGITLAAGASLVGEGYMRSVIKALPNGGSLSDLVNYVKGSVIKRAFTPGQANVRVDACYLADFSVILNHPAYNAGNYQQIGLDLRHISYSKVARVYVGNVAPTTQGFPIATPTPGGAGDSIQGYGSVIGTKAGGAIDYCGGEGNRLSDPYIAGAFKCIVIDDSTLTPSSSAHATVLDNPKCEQAHELIGQESSTTTGVSINNAITQNIVRQTGNANPTIAMVLTGYGIKAHIKYAELGAAADVLLSLASASARCAVEISEYSYTTGSAGAITDTGTKNYVRYNAGVTGGGSTLSSGALVELYSKALLNPTYKAAWSTGSEVLSAANGITMARNGTGDYTMTLSPAQPNANWLAMVLIDADASGHGGLVAFSNPTQSTTALRFFTYSQNGATTTAVDPRMMMVQVRQAV